MAVPNRELSNKFGAIDWGDQVDKTVSNSYRTQEFKAYLYCIEHTCQADDKIPLQITMMPNKKGSKPPETKHQALYCVWSQQDRVITKTRSASFFRNMHIVIIPPCGEEHTLSASLDNLLNLAKTKFNGCS